MAASKSKKGKKTCIKCGVELAGRAQKWCDVHRPNRSNRKLLAQAHANAGDAERARQILEAGKTTGGGGAEGVEGWEPLLYAAALTVTSDRERARRIAGLPSGIDLKALDAQAREEWDDLIHLRGAGMQQLGYMLLIQALARLGPAMASMPVGQIPSAARSITEALEKLQTAIKPTFTTPNIVWDFGPQDDV